MKVKLRGLMATSEGIFKAGSVVDVSKEKATALIKEGSAQPVSILGRVERAIAPPEKVVDPDGGKKRDKK